MRTGSKTRLALAELEGGVDSATERWLHLATPPQTMGRRDLGAAGELANRSWRSERAYADLPRSFWLPIQRATSLVLGTYLLLLRLAALERDKDTDSSWMGIVTPSIYFLLIIPIINTLFPPQYFIVD